MLKTLAAWASFRGCATNIVVVAFIVSRSESSMSNGHAAAIAKIKSRVPASEHGMPCPEHRMRKARCSQTLSDDHREFTPHGIEICIAQECMKCLQQGLCLSDDCCKLACSGLDAQHSDVSKKIMTPIMWQGSTSQYTQYPINKASLLFFVDVIEPKAP